MTDGGIDRSDDLTPAPAPLPKASRFFNPGVVSLAGLALLAGFFVWAVISAPDTAESPSTDDGKAAVTISLPADLQAFNSANNDAITAYDAADNDLKKSVVRKNRDEKVYAALMGGVFSNWPGTLTKLGTDGDGDAYIIVQPDGCNCTVATTNNSVSESLDDNKTLIKMGSPLFQKLLNMHEGDRVIVAGELFKETSLTEQGSVDEPEWEVAFSDVVPSK